MRCKGWCVLCYSGMKGRQAYKGHFGYIPRKPLARGDFMEFVKRASGSGRPGEPGAKLADADFAHEYPALHEYVSAAQWEDGKARKTTTLLLFIEDGRWKLMLNDKENSNIAFLAADTFVDLLETAETKLAAGAVEWRRQKPFPGKR